MKENKKLSSRNKTPNDLILEKNLDDLFHKEEWKKINNILYDNIITNDKNSPTSQISDRQANIINILKNKINNKINNKFYKNFVKIYDIIDNIEILLILLPLEQNDKIRNQYIDFLNNNINGLLKFDENDADKQFSIIKVVQKLIDSNLFNEEENNILANYLIVQNNHFNDNNKMTFKKITNIQDPRFNKLTIQCNEYKINTLKTLYSDNYLSDYKNLNLEDTKDDNLIHELIKKSNTKQYTINNIDNIDVEQQAKVQIEYLTLIKQQQNLLKNNINIDSEDSFSKNIIKHIKSKYTKVKSEAVDAIQMTAEGYVAFKLVNTKGNKLKKFIAKATASWIALSINAQLLNKKIIDKVFNEEEKTYHLEKRNKMPKEKKQKILKFFLKNSVENIVCMVYKINSFFTRLNRLNNNKQKIFLNKIKINERVKELYKKNIKKHKTLKLLESQMKRTKDHFKLKVEVISKNSEVTLEQIIEESEEGKIIRFFRNIQKILLNLNTKKKQINLDEKFIAENNLILINEINKLNTNIIDFLNPQNSSNINSKKIKTTILFNIKSIINFCNELNQSSVDSTGKNKTNNLINNDTLDILDQLTRIADLLNESEMDIIFSVEQLKVINKTKQIIGQQVKSEEKPMVNVGLSDNYSDNPYEDIKFDFSDNKTKAVKRKWFTLF